MPRKKPPPAEIVAKLRRVDVLLSQGRPVAEAIRTIGVMPFTCYRWRKEFGGLKSDQVKRLEDLEKDRAIGTPVVRETMARERLRKAMEGGVGPDAGEADPQGGRLGKFSSPARRRRCLDHVLRA